MSVRGCVCPLRVCLSVVVKNFTVNKGSLLLFYETLLYITVFLGG